MALSNVIHQARRQTATRENRLRQRRAELRLEEIVKVSGIADEYMEIDRAGDLEMETWFATAFQSMPNTELQQLIVRGYTKWLKTERQEEVHVTGEVDDSVSLLKTHNPTFIEGTWVPADSDGAA